MRSRTPVIIMIVALVAIVVVAGLIVANQNQRKSTTDTASIDKNSHTHEGLGRHSHENSGPHSHDSGAAENENDEASTSVTIAIENFAFAPAKITVKAGAKITWTNKDSVAHTATSDDGAPERFDSRLLQQGESFTKTFTKPGTYTYHCTPHPNMQGTIVVT